MSDGGAAHGKDRTIARNAIIMVHRIDDMAGAGFRGERNSCGYRVRERGEKWHIRDSMSEAQRVIA